MLSGRPQRILLFNRPLCQRLRNDQAGYKFLYDGRSVGAVAAPSDHSVLHYFIPCEDLALIVSRRTTTWPSCQSKNLRNANSPETNYCLLLRIPLHDTLVASHPAFRHCHSSGLLRSRAFSYSLTILPGRLQPSITQRHPRLLLRQSPGHSIGIGSLDLLTSIFG